jgi:GAF domain-containing protein/anti-sigma regulatory factor (Ser/Thr protein kinase)
MIGAVPDRRVLESLQQVTDAALAHLSRQDLLDELLSRITEILETDTAAILLLEPDGATLRARAAKGIEAAVEHGVPIPLGRGFAGRIAAEGRAVTIDDVDHADIHNPVLRESGIRSLLGVPLLVEGRVLGVLHVGSLTPRTFTADDRDLLQLAADRAALAIEHARLYEQERAARQAAERASQRLESLQSVTDATLAYLPQDDLLAALLSRITEALGVDTAAILLLEPDGAMLRARAAKGLEEEVRQGVRIPVGRGFAGRIAAESRAVTIDDVDHADILNPILRETGIRSLLGVPLLVEGRVLGVLHVGSLTRRNFTTDDRDLLQLAADRAALAIEHARLYEQRRLAEAIQRRLLPDELPSIPGLELASAYRPASGESLGGDWYDAFELSGGRIALAVGDVVGHGLAAAAVMAQLRAALRAYAVEEHPAAGVVERVNALMWQLGPTAMTTLAYLVLDPAEESLELVNAGHPPPLVIARDGEVSYLPLQGGIALGASSLATYHSETFAFATGSKVVLYTDGLVERPGTVIDEGIARLAEAVDGVGTDPEALCDHLLATLVPDGNVSDDVALLALRNVPMTNRIRSEFEAAPEALASMRGLLRRWLRHAGADDQETAEIVTACGEAATNAIEHAGAAGDVPFEVAGRLDGQRVDVTVRDRGAWRSPRDGDRGRGLSLMRALMDHVEVSPGPDGTRVRLQRELSGEGDS